MNGTTWMVYIILFVVAFLPSVAYIVWIRNTERYEREPWGTIFKTFIWGAIFGVILGVLFSLILIVLFDFAAPERVYNAIAEDEGYYSLFLACIIAPIAEEAAKGIGVFTAGSELDEVEDGLIYGASVGLGFAATENLLYGYIALQESVALFIATAIVRSISSALLHASATSATGYGIAKKKILGKGHFILPYLLLAVVMHGLFNLFASMGTLFGLLLAIMFAIVAIEFTRHKIHQWDATSILQDRWRGHM
ncbi:MAG: PrsW family intramembrane metalloprotease [Methanomassiliicoccales archaeon]|nr:MAG: PrsW family intramembrane metalloprotease [Methanomassiliicoccales archaeon]